MRKVFRKKHQDPNNNREKQFVENGLNNSLKGKQNNPHLTINILKRSKGNNSETKQKDMKRTHPQNKKEHLKLAKVKS